MLQKERQMPINGDRLRRIREKRGLSQRELARLCHIGEMQIYRYENGKGEPSADFLARIARQLDVSTDYLLNLSNNEVGLLREEPLTVEQRRLLLAFNNHDARYFTLLVAKWLQEKLDSDVDLSGSEETPEL